MSAFEALMEGFCLQTGIAKEQVCGKESVNLIFDERIGVEISNDAVNGEVCLASRLFEVDNEEDLGEMAMLIAQANFEKIDLYRAHLAMNEKGTVILIRDVPVHALNEASFNKLMKEFVDAATQWSDSIASMSRLLEEHRDRDAGSPAAEESAVKIKV